MPCVIYAAKSTEDRRGSIPAQLAECRQAIHADPAREVVAEYSDEAFSAYRRDRGPGLLDATQHTEDLAAEHELAELWVQHSDRLARGDGRNARHTVELALWALKHDIRIRSLQDPDTFRDLLYAVVTGQRNNEDSRRKALSSQAGRRRAIERGELVHHTPDGYRLHISLDENGEVHRRLVFDPVREPLLELIFRLALRGRNCGQIAKTLNNQGWVTKPARRCDRPRPFDYGKVWELLRNPRYAALSPWKGVIVARGHWPAYITERQHQHIRKQLRKPRDGHDRGPLDEYLLKGVGRCGRCGHPLRVHTGRIAADGTRARSYVCASHRQYRGNAQCAAAPFNAHVAEAMVIASLETLIEHTHPESHTQQLPWEQTAGSPYIALSHRVTSSQRHARELADINNMQAWIEQEAHGRSETSKSQSPIHNRALRGWFESITIAVTPREVVIGAIRRNARGSGPSAQVRIDRAAWVRRAPDRRRQLTRPDNWDPSEIIGALQAWADQHGRTPERVDWKAAAPGHPMNTTVCRHFNSWNRALRAAGLHPPAPPRRHPWTDQQIILALRSSAREHGRPPTYLEWKQGTTDHPCAQTVWYRFGKWSRALEAAGLEPPPRHGWEGRRYTRGELVDQLTTWAAAHGHPPHRRAWARAAPDHANDETIATRFGNWQAALDAAGLPQRTRLRDPAWSEPQILAALTAWAHQHHRPPRPIDWLKTAPSRPSTGTVRNRFGDWPTALTAAGLQEGSPCV